MQWEFFRGKNQPQKPALKLRFNSYLTKAVEFPGKEWLWVVFLGGAPWKIPWQNCPKTVQFIPFIRPYFTSWGMDSDHLSHRLNPYITHGRALLIIWKPHHKICHKFYIHQVWFRLRIFLGGISWPPAIIVSGKPFGPPRTGTGAVCAKFGARAESGAVGKGLVKLDHFPKDRGEH